MKMVHVARLTVKDVSALTPVQRYIVRSITGADNQTFTPAALH